MAVTLDSPTLHGNGQVAIPHLALPTPNERLATGYRRVFVEYWPYWAATLAAAVLNIFYFTLLGSAWGVTTEFTRMGGHVMGWFGVDVNQWGYFSDATGIGLVIERGRICFTNAFRELWITRQGHLARAIALAMIVSTIGFAVQVGAGAKVKVEYASLGALVGGVLFGIGIVLAGGCETGWMYRSVQGYVQLWMAGLGTVVGTIVLAFGWDHWGIYDVLVNGSTKVNLGKASAGRSRFC